MFVSIHSIVVYFPQSSVYAVIVAMLMFCYFLNGSWVCGDPVYVQICNPTIPWMTHPGEICTLGLHSLRDLYLGGGTQGN